MLSADVVEGDEAYEFTWVGKKAAIVEANKPIRKTLRPCPEESVDWDTTENLYIEGDKTHPLYDHPGEGHGPDAGLRPSRNRTRPGIRESGDPGLFRFPGKNQPIG